MPRKLKTYITNLGFFEMAIAAPSMKAALEAWGMGHNAFHQGFAKETNLATIVAATVAKPGIILKRPVGTKGAFTESAELPKQLWMETARKTEPPKKTSKAQTKPKVMPKPSPKSARADQVSPDAISSFEKAKEKRNRERDKNEARETARKERENARIERALAKADQIIQKTRDRHDGILSDIEAKREQLDHQTEAENQRWEKERHKLEAARKRATE